MTAYPVMPGVPAAGHMSRGGFWHPGAAETCDKCTFPHERGCTLDPLHPGPCSTTTTDRRTQ